MRFRTTTGTETAETDVIRVLCAGLLALIAGQLCFAQTSTRPASTTQSGAVSQRSESWLSIFPTRQQIYGLYEDIKSPDTLYACTHRGLFRSSNGGRSWALMYGLDATSLSFAQSNVSPNVMYSGFGAGQKGAVLKSTDAGRTWQSIGSQDIQRTVHGVYVDSKNPDILYVLADSVGGAFVCSGCVLYKSLNGGRTWGNVTPNGRFLAIDPINPNHLLAAGARIGGSSLIESTDGGASWQQNATVVPVYRRGRSGATNQADDWLAYFFHPLETGLPNHEHPYVARKLGPANSRAK
jgi:hypothetical protein